MAVKATKVAATKPVNKVAAYTPDTYSSQYQGQIDSALGAVTDREGFQYDPLKDANYQQLAKVYNQNGEKAAKNTLGDAAALNGGYGSSYAVSAAQQARNDYNQQLAALIPELEQNAYGRYKDSFDMDVTKLNALRDADDVEYGRYRDTVADKQWKYSQDYAKYRDDVADYQWGANFNESARQWAASFNESAKEWAKEFAENKRVNAANIANTKANTANTKASTKYTNKQIKLLGKSSGSGSGGGSKKKKSSGGGGGSNSGYVLRSSSSKSKNSSSGGDDWFSKAFEKASSNANSKKSKMSGSNKKTTKKTTKKAAKKNTKAATKKSTKKSTKSIGTFYYSSRNKR